MIISPVMPSPVTLPDELLTEVLSLLNVKSLVRFKCVNKSWNTLISDPFFVNMHFIKSSQNPHMILFPSLLMTHFRISLHDPFQIRSLPDNHSINLFPKDSIFKMQINCYIIGSCNGLTCLVSSHYPWETEFYLWNPATRWLSQKLASLNSSARYPISGFNFSFGYDSLTHKYKLVAIRPNEVKILIFGDNLWRNIQTFPTNPYMYSSSDVNAGVYLNNTLNWFAIRIKVHLNQQFVIISLDLGVETWTQFLFPQGFDQVPSALPIVCRLMECLCFYYYSTAFSFVIWQMKEFGVEESWTKLLKFDYQNILHLDSSRVVNLLPLHVFENGDTLILACNLKQLICYSTRENRVVRQATVTDSIQLDRFNVNHYVESMFLQ